MSDAERPQDPSQEEQPTESEAAADQSAAAGDGDAPSLPPGGDAPSGDEPDQDEKEDEDIKQMSLLDHLDELRWRLTRCAIASVVGFLACYSFAERMFRVLMEPLVKTMPPDSSLIYTNPPEAFFTYLKVAFVAGIFLASPYIFYQIWAFVAPGLYKEERVYIVPMAFFSALFFTVGAMFGYLVVFPFAFDFFFSFANELIKPMPSLKEYLSFSLKLLFAFGLVFELPLFVFFLARLGLVTAKGMRRYRKYAILCAFIVGAVLTPPDVVSQCLMAGPLLILFELSIFVALIFGKKKPGKQEDEEEEKAEAAAAE